MIFVVVVVSEWAGRMVPGTADPTWDPYACTLRPFLPAAGAAAEARHEPRWSLVFAEAASVSSS